MSRIALALSFLFAAACTEQHAAAPPPPITLLGPDGQVQARAVATRPDHWRVEDGEGAKLGKISVSADRVKVKDVEGALRAKVKRRDGGLKLEDGAGATLLKVKQKGPERFDIEDDAGAALGRVEGLRAEWGEQSLSAHAIGDGHVEVRAGDAVRLAAQGPVPAGAALIAARPGLDRFARVGLLVFLYAIPPE